MAISEQSNDPNIPAVRAEHTSGGQGIAGFSDAGPGVVGFSKTNAGIIGESNSPDQPGVLGKGTDWTGVLGTSINQSGVSGRSENFVGGWFESTKQTGVFGKSQEWVGVVGESVNQAGVSGKSQNFVGGWFESTKQTGVFGKSQEWAGVVGESVNQAGVSGKSQNFVGGWFESVGQTGVVGISKTWRGVDGQSEDNAGVVGISKNFVGVWAETNTTDRNQPALLAKHTGGVAGHFEGDIEVTGDILLTNADCAEDFDIACVDQIEPGTVMVIDNDGALQQSNQAYDKRVAGVISGAGNYKPGIVLDKQASSNNRMPVALLGKVYCKVDARDASVEVGDLLTSSSTPGHAMKVTDHQHAFGAVIGKALRPLKDGLGLIPILIALQ